MKKIVISLSLLIAAFAAPTYAETFGDIVINDYYNPDSGITRSELVATAAISRDENSPAEFHYPRIYINMTDYDGGYIGVSAFGTTGGYFSCYVTANQHGARFEHMQKLVSTFNNGAQIYIGTSSNKSTCTGMRLVKSDRHHLN